MGIGALDTDSAALRRRLEVQDRLGQFDLNDWIFSHFPIREGQRWLDLGCGRGKQSLAIAPRVGSAGSVTAFDLSGESLDALRAQAVAADCSEQLCTVQGGLDQCGDLLAGQRFDRALGSYSLYYVQDAPRLFGFIEQALAEDGQLFFCGPAHGNNMELRQLLAEAGALAQVLEPTRPSTFMEKLGPAICEKLFPIVRRFELRNEIHFHTTEDLVAYWRSHNLFDASLETAFCDIARQALAGGRSFVNTKRGVGILAKKGI